MPRTLTYLLFIGLLLGWTSCQLNLKRSYSVRISAEQLNTRVSVNDGEVVSLPVELDVHTFNKEIDLTFYRRDDTLNTTVPGTLAGRIGRGPNNVYLPERRDMYRYRPNYHWDWKKRAFEFSSLDKNTWRISIRALNSQVGIFNNNAEQAYVGFGFVRPGIEYALSGRKSLNLSYGYGKDFCRRLGFFSAGQRNYQHQYVNLLYQYKLPRGQLSAGLQGRRFVLGSNNRGNDGACSEVHYTTINSPFVNSENTGVGLVLGYEYNLSRTLGLYTEYVLDLGVFAREGELGRLSWFQLGFHLRTPAFRLGKRRP